jgi:hypothetical protein
MLVYRPEISPPLLYSGSKSLLTAGVHQPSSHESSLVGRISPNKGCEKSPVKKLKTYRRRDWRAIYEYDSITR